MPRDFVAVDVNQRRRHITLSEAHTIISAGSAVSKGTLDTPVTVAIAGVRMKQH
jgi:hypothetical protein